MAATSLETSAFVFPHSDDSLIAGVGLLAQEARLESEVDSVKNLRSKFEYIYSTLQAKYRPRSADRTPAAHGSLEKRFQKVGIEQQHARAPLGQAVNRPFR